MAGGVADLGSCGMGLRAGSSLATAGAGMTGSCEEEPGAGMAGSATISVVTAPGVWRGMLRRWGGEDLSGGVARTKPVGSGFSS